MKFNNVSVASTPEILKRKTGAELIIPVTLKAVDASDDAIEVVKAGNPIDASGYAVNDNTAVGILLNDVYPQENPNGALIKAYASVNTANANANANITIADGVKTALSNITFE